MEDWKEYRLGDICLKIGSGATPSGGKEAYKGGNFNLVRSQNVLDFSFSDDGLARINDEQAEKLKNVDLYENDVLLNITGDSVARSCILPNWVLPARVNQHVCILRADPDFLDYRYLLYFIQTKKNKLLAMAAGGATRNALTKQMLEDFKINLPPLPIQQKIAQILSSLDDKIELNNKINANLEQQAQALFKSWFVDGQEKNGTIGDYCNVKSGFAFKSSWWQDSGLKVVRIGDIEQGKLSLDSCAHVLNDKQEIAKDFILKGGDLVIAMTGATIGKFSMVPKTDEIILANQRVGKFFLGENPIERVPFLYCTLCNEEVITEFINRGQGSAQPNISTGDILSISCWIPESSEIERFNKTAEPLFETIISNQSENKKLSNLRDTLLPKLMNGEICL